MSERAHFDKARLKMGLNTETNQPFWYPEIRFAPRKWARLARDKQWVRFDNKADAEAEVFRLNVLAANREPSNG